MIPGAGHGLLAEVMLQVLSDACKERLFFLLVFSLSHWNFLETELYPLPPQLNEEGSKVQFLRNRIRLTEKNKHSHASEKTRDITSGKPLVYFMPRVGVGGGVGKAGNGCRAFANYSSQMAL